MVCHSEWSRRMIFFVIFFISSITISAQGYQVSGEVKDEKGIPLNNVEVSVFNSSVKTFTNAEGYFKLQVTKKKKAVVVLYKADYNLKSIDILVPKDTFVRVELKLLKVEINPFEVKEEKQNNFGIEKLNPVDGTRIFASKKSEVVLPDDLIANRGANNARQIYAKITGLNIWENDGAGLQLNIGGRGLSPNRTSNFNTRQNGYDISADALGYPESYYTPPTEAVEKIEVVRGASSLQYGTQFGGMLNFKMKEGEDKKIGLTQRFTYGSFNLMNSFTSLGGQVKKLNYYTFFQYKQSDGWRLNSEFNQYTVGAFLNYEVNTRFKINVDFTRMYYLAHQPGGLRDIDFEVNPQISYRERNWFRVNWNVGAVNLFYQLSEKSEIEAKFFGLLASREALGYLGPISQVDPIDNPFSTDLDKERNLIYGRFQNVGSEVRYLTRYTFRENTSVFLAGVRVYNGNTTSKQAAADAGYDANFSFVQDEQRNFSDYVFPSLNTAFFTENIFNFSKKFSVTPGVRVDYIDTQAKGSYRQVLRLLNQEVYFDSIYSTQKQHDRVVVLGGLGASFKPKTNKELYFNFSQNYRAINFNDFVITNPNYRVDTNLQDEKGFNIDLGFRGSIKNFMVYDVTAFYLFYNNKIGFVQATDENTYAVYRLRTNVSQSQTVGLETFVEYDFWKHLVNDTLDFGWSVFVNGTVLDGRYINSAEPAYENKLVELVPPVILKTGTTVKNNNWGLTYQFSYVYEHYTDATNAVYTTNAVNGIIPTYFVSDFSGFVQWKKLKLEAGINNLFDQYYFTRRATGYPGPGILPADPRTFYVTLQLKL